MTASLVPEKHTLVVSHPDALEFAQTLDVTDAGTRVVVALWQRNPSAFPLSAVYPGASLADARFLAGGRVELVANLSTGQAALSQSLPMREAWRLDPHTGQVAHVTLAGLQCRHP